MIENLLVRIEEKDQAMKDKDFFITNISDTNARLSEWVRDLESILNERDQALSFVREELENEKASVSRLQNEVEKWREDNSLLRSDSRGLQSELEDAQEERNMLKQTLSETEVNFRALRANLEKEQQERQRLKEELLQSRRTCAELERDLENERLLSQSNQQAAQTREETIREQMRELEQERELKLGLEERVRGLQTEVDEERTRRVTTERELQSAVSVAQEALAEYRRLEPRDWIIGRNEVIISEKILGAGGWAKVTQGNFRGFQVAVKQIHDLILSPHNRELFEREMSIASRCRHPNLLQFMGATNDDGSPLFVTELLDTDLRKVLSQRSLHHEEIVCLALDVATALNYLHLNPFPIIHRDISSSNVLLWRRDDRWRAKLSDYGAANFMRQCMTSNPGARIYAAPEALTSKQSPKVREA